MSIEQKIADIFGLKIHEFTWKVMNESIAIVKFNIPNSYAYVDGSAVEKLRKFLQAGQINYRAIVDEFEKTLETFLVIVDYTIPDDL